MLRWQKPEDHCRAPLATEEKSSSRVSVYLDAPPRTRRHQNTRKCLFSDYLTNTTTIIKIAVFANYLAYCWKANGGTTSSNTDGSITSTVQAKVFLESIITRRSQSSLWEMMWSSHNEIIIFLKEYQHFCSHPYLPFGVCTCIWDSSESKKKIQYYTKSQFYESSEVDENSVQA